MPQNVPSLSHAQAELEAAALVNRGIECIHAQRFDEALNCLNRALAIRPGMALAYFNRGVLFQNMAQRGAMIADFGRAMQLDPDNFDIFFNVGIFCLQEKQYMQSIQATQRAIELKPDHAPAWLMLASAYYETGNSDAVEKLLERLVQKFPDDRSVQVADALFPPPLPRSREALDPSRARFLGTIDDLTRRGIGIADPLMERYNSLFFLAYHGRPHKEMAQRVAQFFLKSCPELEYTAAHCKKPRKKAGAKIRVGFVSPSMHENTLNQFLLKIIEKLGEHPAFEVYVFSSAPPLHPNVQSIRKRLSRYVDLPRNLKEAQQVIAREEMDILLYMEVGSDQLMYCLPFARLAHMQCVWGGIPVTTGIPNMDHFISNSDCEPEGAEAHYSERLVMLSRTLSVFSRPNIP